MATEKVPIRTVFNASGTATGLAEYQSGEVVGVIHGGTGAETLTSNAILLGNGTNAIQNSAIGISGTTLSSTDSTLITIDEGLTVTGNLDVSGTITGTLSSSSSTSGNIQVGVTSSTTIDTTSGNLTINSAGGTVQVDDNLEVTGNLTVTGTTTTVQSTNTVLTDNLMELNSGASTNSNDAGIIIERGSTGDNAIIAWDESADKFTLGTTTATASDTGNLVITKGTIVADLEGNVTGDITGDVTGDVTGNASTATALQTSRTIAGVSFDGTSNITIASTDLSDTASITLLTASQTLENKSIDGNSNTITGLDAANMGDGSVSNTEFQFLNGVTSSIQTQLNTKASTAFALAQAVALG